MARFGLFRVYRQEEVSIYRRGHSLGCKIRGYTNFSSVCCSHEHGHLSNGCEDCVSECSTRAWYDMLSSFLISNDFSKGSVDPTLFIRREGNELILISQSPRGIFINQSKYALESLKKYGYESCDPVDTPIGSASRKDEHLNATKKDLFSVSKRTVHRGLGIRRFVLAQQHLQMRIMLKSDAITQYGTDFIALSGGCRAQVLDEIKLTDYALDSIKFPIINWRTSSLKLLAEKELNYAYHQSYGNASFYRRIPEQLADEVDELVVVPIQNNPG
ncbi:hypothetical protein Tco_0878263 [Tanacetum coccineum]|uniref:Reverse transcriptase Ty1/copia-type domain-containing protein n=1 Tax=Tanacetum coccineum TaxID=301880 RepID=A0ABQ5C0P9_9ASTR